MHTVEGYFVYLHVCTEQYTFCSCVAKFIKIQEQYVIFRLHLYTIHTSICNGYTLYIYV
jgi:hypothetical protein